MSIATLEEKYTLLEKVLLADAAYCALSGSVTLLGAGAIAPLLGVDQTWIVALVGIVVVLYAAGLALLARRGAREWLGWTAVALNVAWIDGTILLLLGDWLALEPAGRWLLILLAAGVSIFAVAGAYATWQQRRASG